MANNSLTASYESLPKIAKIFVLAVGFSCSVNTDIALH